MKICLVTTFPPSQGGLSEYGLHIAEELRRNPFLSLTILADQIPQPQLELEGFSVERCWSFDDPTSAARLLRAVVKLKPDVVWLNLLFSTFLKIFQKSCLFLLLFVCSPLVIFNSLKFFIILLVCWKNWIGLWQELRNERGES